MGSIEHCEINYICSKCSDRFLLSFLLPTGDSVVEGSEVTWGDVASVVTGLDVVGSTVDEYYHYIITRI